ncbi:MAG: 5-formyltetrahydrofolate cyclo-ligase, partial [Halieaceae bacterium]
MAAEKTSIRKRLRQFRNALSVAQRKTAEAQSLILLRRWPAWRKAAVIASYMPYQSEFNPEGLTRDAASRGATLVYPRVTTAGLQFHQW